jgi:hypothetical protein
MLICYYRTSRFRNGGSKSLSSKHRLHEHWSVLWLDSIKPNGLPYIRSGVVNPEGHNYPDEAAHENAAHKDTDNFLSR